MCLNGSVRTKGSCQITPVYVVLETETPRQRNMPAVIEPGNLVLQPTDVLINAGVSE